jgi:putative endonuclease
MTSQKPRFFYIYVLLSQKDNKFYIGYSEDLVTRIKDHQHGRVHSTKNRLPVKLIHYEAYIEKSDAKAREVFLKSGFGREQLRLSLKKTLLKLL